MHLIFFMLVNNILLRILSKQLNLQKFKKKKNLIKNIVCCANFLPALSPQDTRGAFPTIKNLTPNYVTQNKLLMRKLNASTKKRFSAVLGFFITFTAILKFLIFLRERQRRNLFWV